VIEAVILVGGQGSRLRELFPSTAKAMVPINGRPFIDFVVDYLVGQGVRRIVLATGYLHEQLVSHFAPRRDAEFILCVETMPLGTGGAIKHALNSVKGGRFLALNGDSLCPVPIRSVVELHDRKRAAATLVVSRKFDRSDGGTVVVDQDSMVLDFVEKGASGRGNIGLSAGIYVLNNDPRELDDWGAVFSLERDVFPTWASRRQCAAFVTDEPVMDVGTPDRYRFAKEALAKGT
jgi:D-glycero-alpha-D-manno-heptose 1-phosphate guanylyltransferase